MGDRIHGRLGAGVGAGERLYGIYNEITEESHKPGAKSVVYIGVGADSALETGVDSANRIETRLGAKSRVEAGVETESARETEVEAQSAVETGVVEKVEYKDK